MLCFEDDCLIHQTAYDMNLNPLNFSAFFKPRFLHLLNQVVLTIWHYNDTRFASVNFSFLSPCLTLTANSISLSGSSGWNLLISCKYLLNDLFASLPIFWITCSAFVFFFLFLTGFFSGLSVALVTVFFTGFSLFAVTFFVDFFSTLDVFLVLFFSTFFCSFVADFVVFLQLQLIFFLIFYYLL